MGAREKAPEAPLPAVDLRGADPRAAEETQGRMLIAPRTLPPCSPKTRKDGREEKKRRKRGRRGRERGRQRGK